MPEALPLVAQPDLPSQVDAVERDGYAYLPGVLDRDQVAELRGHMERLEPLAVSYDRASEDGFLNRAINNAFQPRPALRAVPGLPRRDRDRRGGARGGLPRDRHDLLADRAGAAGPGAARRLPGADAAGGGDGRSARAHSGVHRHRPLLPGRPGRGDRPDPLHPRQPPRRPPARRRRVLAGPGGAEHPLQRGRRGDLPERGVASRQRQPQRPRAPSAARSAMGSAPSRSGFRPT